MESRRLPRIPRPPRTPPVLRAYRFFSSSAAFSITGTVPATIAFDSKTGEPSPVPEVAKAAAVASNGAAPRPAGTQ